MRSRLEKSAAPWILNDIVQKTASSANRIVLVVYAAIDMAAIGVRNQVRGRLLMPVLPGREIEASGRIEGAQRRGPVQFNAHEAPLKHFAKSGGRNRLMVRTEHHELRLNARDIRSRHQRLQHCSKEPMLVLPGPAGSPHVQVANKAFVLVIDEVGGTKNSAAFDQRVTIQGALIDKALDQFRGSMKVPGHGIT